MRGNLKGGTTEEGYFGNPHEYMEADSNQGSESHRGAHGPAWLFPHLGDFGGPYVGVLIRRAHLGLILESLICGNSHLQNHFLHHLPLQVDIQVTLAKGHL